jgi:hypothetical protein
MRVRKWLLGFVVAGSATGAVVAGCGSSDNSTPPPADSGTDQTNADTGSPPDAANEAGDTGSEAAACVPDADITMLMVPDAAIGDSGVTLPECYACIQTTCQAQLAACNLDCGCNTAVQQFAICIVDPTMTLTQCGTGLVVAGGSAGTPLLACVGGKVAAALGGSGPGCVAQCAPSLLMGDGGGTDGASDAAGDDGGGDATTDGSADSGG